MSISWSNKLHIEGCENLSLISSVLNYEADGNMYAKAPTLFDPIWQGSLRA